jgi:glycosyltransferase involved in cell wall biosynthesis
VDTETFAPNNNLRAAAREKYDLTGNTILMIAGIHPRKRLDLLIKAAPRILGAIPDAQILFTGEVYDRMYYSTLRDLISRYGLETNIRFLGFQKHIQEIEAAADVLVMCSAEEPFARALLEALAMELPVVAVNTGGVAELITHMQTGVLVDNPNPDSLADRIVSALTDDDLRARLKIQGRLAVCNGFSIAAHTQSVMEIYDDLLEG